MPIPEVMKAINIRLMIIPTQKAHEILNARKCEGVSVFATYPTTNGIRLIPQGLKITLAIPHKNAPRNFNEPDEYMKSNIPLTINFFTPHQKTVPAIFASTAVSHLTAKAGGFQRSLVHGLNV